MIEKIIQRRARNAVLALLFPSGLISIGLVWIHSNYSVSSLAVVGRPFPDIPFETFEGEPGELSFYRNKPVLAAFFDLQCGLCDNQIAVLEEVGKKRDSELGIAAIFERGSMAKKEESELMSFSFDKFVASATQIRKGLGYFAVPAFFFINPEGILVRKHNGFLTSGKLDSLVHRTFFSSSK